MTKKRKFHLPPVSTSPTYEGAQAIARLQQLGLSHDLLQRALFAGNASANAVTDAHPRTHAGQMMYGDTTARLRIDGRAHDLEGEYYAGVELTLHPGTGVAIVVTSGDESTGLASYSPQVRYDRGHIIAGIANGDLDNLFRSVAHGRPNWSLYFLLHFRFGHEVRAELSRPVAINKGFVTDWAERIVLDTHSDGSPQRASAPADLPAAPEIVAPRRRAG